eukprot:gene32332-52753_t
MAGAARKAALLLVVAVCVFLGAVCGGAVMLTYAGSSHLDFVRSWAAHLDAARIAWRLVAALDDPLAAWLRGAGIDHFRADTELRTDDPSWPLRHDGGLDRRRGALSACTGVLYFRHHARAFVERWREWPKQKFTGVYYDQPSFMEQCREGQPPKGWQADADGYFPAWKGQARVGTLPPYLFLNGHTFFVQQLHTLRLSGVPPYSVHASFANWGAAGKRHRFREAMLWHDPPEYYDPPGGVLTYDVDLPDELRTGFVAGEHVRDAFETEPRHVTRHFTLVHAQLAQLRAALAVARALWCGFDRAYSPHTGTFPGSNFSLPFRCPLDIVLDLYRLQNFIARGTLERDGGSWHSFLLNSRLPQSVAASVAELGRRHSSAKVLRLGRGVVGLSFPDARLRDMWWDKVPHTDVVNRRWDGPWRPVPGDRWGAPKPAG